MSAFAITGIVVTYNEDRHLEECLESLSFCSEILVFDMGSSDKSIEIAKSSGAKVFYIERKPIVETVRFDAIEYAKNDWVVFMDPDMIFPLYLYDRLCRIIPENSSLAWIELPYLNYFRGKRLNFSRWMRPGIYPAILNKNRVEFSSNVHAGMKIIDGYEKYRINPNSSEGCITHYWGESYRHIIQKHLRYIKQEGKSMFYRGKIFTWREMFDDVYKELKDGVLKYRGVSGGFHAWLLTLFWLWYVVMRWVSLYKYQKQIT